MVLLELTHLLQRVHLGHHLADVGVHFHQVHAVQRSLEQVHHGLQLQRGHRDGAWGKGWGTGHGAGARLCSVGRGSGPQSHHTTDTLKSSGACFFSFSIFHSFSQGLSEEGGAVQEHLQSAPELTVSTV